MSQPKILIADDELSITKGLSAVLSDEGYEVVVAQDGKKALDLLGAAVPLTNFPVDPDLLVSDIGAFAWVTNDQILFGKDGQLWTVWPSSDTPARSRATMRR